MSRRRWIAATVPAFSLSNPPPDIVSLDVATGTALGGTTVVLTGTGFGPAGAFSTTTTLTVGGTAATSFVIDSDTQITAVTPAHAAGAADWVIINPGGTDTLSGAFTFIDIPTVTSIDPVSGTALGGTAVTITGTNFTGCTSAAVGDEDVTSFVVVNGTTITGVTGIGLPGAVHVVVRHPTNGNGQLSNGYTYT